ncbi:MAG: hypothetical protein LBJ12_02545 [Oscillospiraceae bacterium]|jgi:hypothetical protein|nr:hypothetical protein [Oscillospiraceae bacterium]
MQRFCAICKKYRTVDPKTREIPDELKQQATKAYFEGLSDRAAGRLYGMSKANVLNWIKKTNETTRNKQMFAGVFEIDEPYWFLEKKARTETGQRERLFDDDDQP